MKIKLKIKNKADFERVFRKDDAPELYKESVKTMKADFKRGAIDCTNSMFSLYYQDLNTNPDAGEAIFQIISIDFVEGVVVVEFLQTAK